MATAAASTAPLPSPEATAASGSHVLSVPLSPPEICAQSIQPFIRAVGQTDPICITPLSGAGSRTVQFTHVHQICEFELKKGSPVRLGSMLHLQNNIVGYRPIDDDASAPIEAGLLDIHNVAMGFLGTGLALFAGRRFGCKHGPAASSASSAPAAAPSGKAPTTEAKTATTGRLELETAVQSIQTSLIDTFCALSWMWFSMLTGRVAVHTDAAECARSCMPDHLFWYGAKCEYLRPIPKKDSVQVDKIRLEIADACKVPIETSAAGVRLSPDKPDTTGALARRLRGYARTVIERSIADATRRRRDECTIGTNVFDYVFGLMVYAAFLPYDGKEDDRSDEIGSSPASGSPSVLSGYGCKWLFAGLTPPLVHTSTTAAARSVDLCMGIFEAVRCRFMWLSKNRDGFLRSTAATVHVWSKSTLDALVSSSGRALQLSSKQYMPLFNVDVHEAKVPPPLMRPVANKTSQPRSSNYRFPMLVSWVASTWSTKFLLQNHRQPLRDPRGLSAILAGRTVSGELELIRGITYARGVKAAADARLRLEQNGTLKRPDAATSASASVSTQGLPSSQSARKRLARALRPSHSVVDVHGNRALDTELGLMHISLSLDLAVMAWTRFFATEREPLKRKPNGAIVSSVDSGVRKPTIKKLKTALGETSGTEGVEGEESTETAAELLGRAFLMPAAEDPMDATATSAQPLPAYLEDAKLSIGGVLEDPLRPPSPRPASDDGGSSNGSAGAPALDAPAKVLERGSPMLYVAALQKLSAEIHAPIVIQRLAKSMMIRKTDQAGKGQTEFFRAVLDGLLPYITLYLSFSGPCISLTTSTDNGIACSLAIETDASKRMFEASIRSAATASASASASGVASSAGSEQTADNKLFVDATRHRAKRSTRLHDQMKKGTTTDPASANDRALLSEVVSSCLLPPLERHDSKTASSKKSSRPQTLANDASEETLRVSTLLTLRDPIASALSGPTSLVVFTAPGDKRATTVAYEAPGVVDSRFTPELEMVPGRSYSREWNPDERRRVYPFLTPMPAGNNLAYPGALPTRFLDSGLTPIQFETTRRGCVSFRGLRRLEPRQLRFCVLGHDEAKHAADETFQAFDAARTVVLSSCSIYFWKTQDAGATRSLGDFECDLINRVMSERANEIVAHKRLYEVAMVACLLFRDAFDAHSYTKQAYDRQLTLASSHNGYSEYAREFAVSCSNRLRLYRKRVEAIAIDDVQIRTLLESSSPVTLYKRMDDVFSLSTLTDDVADVKYAIAYDLLYKESKPYISITQESIHDAGFRGVVRAFDAAHESMTPFLAKDSITSAIRSALLLPRGSIPKARIDKLLGICLFYAQGKASLVRAEFLRAYKLISLYTTTASDGMRTGCLAPAAWATFLDSCASCVLQLQDGDSKCDAKLREHVRSYLCDAKAVSASASASSSSDDVTVCSESCIKTVYDWVCDAFARPSASVFSVPFGSHSAPAALSVIRKRLNLS